jgi:small subunit ribosomal protein S9
MMADEETPEKANESPDAPEPSETAQQPEGEQAAEPTAQQEQAEPTAHQAQDEPTVQDQAEPTAQQAQEEPTAQDPAGDGEEAADVVARAQDAAVEAQEETEEAAPAEPEGEGSEEAPTRAKPSVPGAHLEVDIVPEGVDPLGRSETTTYEDPYAIDDEDVPVDEKVEGEEEDELAAPIATAAIDLASGARYRATGKRKSAIARVTLRPGSGAYLVNGRSLEEHFPRATLQRNIRQPLETVGYEDRMDVVARLHGGGISAQAGALRHGVSRALLEADPNLRGELKRRGFLTRDSRAKERKKAGLKKARKRPQFSKR